MVIYDPHWAMEQCRLSAAIVKHYQMNLIRLIDAMEQTDHQQNVFYARYSKQEQIIR
jgi:hypothetical protein